MDVVLLTDHDNLDAARLGEEGWYGRTLLLAGHEVSPPARNHMLAFGVDEEIDWEGLSPREIADAVRDAGGFGIAAHPFSEASESFRWLSSLGKSMRWEDLDCVDGIEVWSFVSDGGQNAEGMRDALRMITRPERYVTHPPRHNLDEWDRLAAKRRVVGIGGPRRPPVRRAGRRPGAAADELPPLVSPAAHPRAGRASRSTASSSTTASWCSTRCARGAVTSAAHAVAPGRGFRFDGRRRGDGRRGRRSTARSCASCFRGRPRCGCCATAVRWRARTAPSLVHRAEGPGVYRVEAYLATYGAAPHLAALQPGLPAMTEVRLDPALSLREQPALGHNRWHPALDAGRLGGARATSSRWTCATRWTAR